MASWMIHLRVAEKLMEAWPDMDAAHFILGNMAPDSGVPTADGYEPSAAVSHFRAIDKLGMKAVHEEQFIDRYFNEKTRKTCDALSFAFYMGYLTHLLTDKLWKENIVLPIRMRLDDLFTRDPEAFWHTIKRDWYDMDFLYLRARPDFPAFRIYRDMPDLRNRWLDFFSETAFADRRAFIVDFYREGAAKVKEREMYISWEELDTFVNQSAEQIQLRLAQYQKESGVIFRKPAQSDLEEIEAFKREFIQTGSGMDGTGILCMTDAAHWLAYCHDMENCSPDKGVRSLQYGLFSRNNNRLLGLLQIRLELKGYLIDFGGHIGYCVRPSERRKGYAKRMLQTALHLCKEQRLERVLVTCLEDNVASARTIEACGGQYEKTVYDDVNYQARMKRYWIHLTR